MWTQVIDPFDNIFLSALVAFVPFAFIFWTLIIKKMKGYNASPVVTVAANVSGVVGKMMSPQLIAVAAAVSGLSIKIRFYNFYL